MKTYDLYQFVSKGGLIRGWHAFEAEGDEAAIEVAEGLAKQTPLELWRDGCLIKRWEQRDKP